MNKNISPNYKPFVKHVHVETPGTLAKLIPSKERDVITSLVITGYLNAKDFDDVIDDMCRVECDYDYEGAPDAIDDYKIDWHETPRLRTLDMGGCELVGQTNLPYFGYKSVLEHLVLPSNVESTIVTEDENSFNGCCLKTLILPNSLKLFDGFSFNSNLKEVVIPDSIEIIGESALSNCTSIESINIPALAKLIGSPFQGCTLLKKFELHPDNPYYTLVDGALFTKDKKTIISYPEGLPATTYTIPSGVEEIGDEAFACTNLKEIRMPSSLKRIGSHCFLSANNLKELVFPDTVEQIGFCCIDCCDSLKTITMLPLLPPEVLGGELISFCKSYKNITLYVPADAIKAYKQHKFWSKFKIKQARTLS